MANNSSGARSVLYGKTIDHVLEQTVLLSDASIVHFREIPRDRDPGRATRSKPSVIAPFCALAEEHAAEIDRRYPKVLRRVGGYNLDEFTDPAETRESRQNHGRVRRHARRGARSQAAIGAAAQSESRDGGRVSRSARIALRRAGDPWHQPSAVEVMDKAILDHTRQNIALDRIRSAIVEGDPAATLCVEFYGDRKENLPPRLQALEQDLRARKLGYHYHTETDPAAQARVWSLREAALGLSMAMKDDAKSISFVEDTAVAPEKLSELHRPFPGDRREVTKPPPEFTRMPQSVACTCARSST